MTVLPKVDSCASVGERVSRTLQPSLCTRLNQPSWYSICGSCPCIIGSKMQPAHALNGGQNIRTHKKIKAATRPGIQVLNEFWLRPNVTLFRLDFFKGDNFLGSFQSPCQTPEVNDCVGFTSRDHEKANAPHLARLG